MKDLSTLNTQELEDFFKSFDHVLTDVDGVVWNFLDSITGASDALTSLEKLNKRIIFVSNNSVISSEVLQTRLKQSGCALKKINFVNPALAIISYLRKQNLTDKTIFVIGMSPLKEALKEAGFKLAENGPNHVEESVLEYVSLCFADDGNVGVVIADYDINLNHLKMQKAVNFLRKKDVLFLSGAREMKTFIDKDWFLLGPGAFVSILENASEKEAITIAKPQTNLNEFIVEKYKIDDASRVLFIGDSILDDMGFAANCGYKKLLVFSGLTKRSCVENWTFPEEYRPDFYAESLKTVHEAILRVWGKR